MTAHLAARALADALVITGEKRHVAQAVAAQALAPAVLDEITRRPPARRAGDEYPDADFLALWGIDYPTPPAAPRRGARR